MSDPISLRNMPTDALHLADAISTQTGLSVTDVLRLALASGLLVEVTKIAPQQDGTLGGLPAISLAKALRRHLGSAIDLLVEHGQHPYQCLMINGQSGEVASKPLTTGAFPLAMPAEATTFFAHSIEDDLDSLGLGGGLAASLGTNASIDSMDVEP
jgi:hypothetical protein